VTADGRGVLSESRPEGEREADAVSDQDPPQNRRREATERRAALERRSGLERRRGPGRRRSDIRREAEEGEITGELLEFVMAMDEYKRQNDRPFPTWTEVFEIIHYLGYRKVAPKAEHINRLSTRPPARAEQ